MNDDIKELTSIAAEQRREFMAARVIEIDPDLAFRLQLEEAVAASLVFQPSSSNSQSQSSQPPIPISNNNGATLAGLDKFETEIKHLDLIESEEKKIIHDQKLAREILHMPEDQWIEDGDNFHRPYGEGSSSSKNDGSEVFRIYFKGLLSEERVNSTSLMNKTVTMAGIGVAILDSKDELLFEMRKPLDLIKDDRISRRSVEVKALIEALTSAIALDLKRVVFYCDYYPLYQHVTGRWRPKQEKVKILVDQVNLLRKSFTHCEPSLVTRKDVKFAIKFAREAINSQIIKVESNQEMLENCVICLDDKYVDQFFSVKHCNHRYCNSCMKQHVEVKLLHGMVPICPHEDCESELKIENCEKFLTPKLTEMMRQRVKEASIPVTEKIYCPYPKCSTLMSKRELIRLPRLLYENGARTCYKCQGDFCINCRVPWHKNMDCTEFKRRNPTQLVEESKLKNLAARNLWRQCVKCKHMIELATGCFHMTCRCGYEFCYTCGAEWKNKKATCSCPLWDEQNIVDTEDEDDFDIMFGVHEDDEDEDDSDIMFGVDEDDVDEDDEDDVHEDDVHDEDDVHEDDEDDVYEDDVHDEDEDEDDEDDVHEDDEDDDDDVHEDDDDDVHEDDEDDVHEDDEDDEDEDEDEDDDDDYDFD